jgi:hypothetical protein
VSLSEPNGVCEHCGRLFPYKLIHNGFNDSTHANCDHCGMTALIYLFEIEKRLGDIKHFDRIVPLPNEVSKLLRSCTCGGLFTGDAGPRCPSCKSELSAAKATTWIEQNARGAKHGWRWQRTWPGLYAIIISDNVINEHFMGDPTHHISARRGATKRQDLSTSG